MSINNVILQSKTDRGRLDTYCNAAVIKWMIKLKPLIWILQWSQIYIFSDATGQVIISNQSTHSHQNDFYSGDTTCRQNHTWLCPRYKSWQFKRTSIVWIRSNGPRNVNGFHAPVWYFKNRQPCFAGCSGWSLYTPKPGRCAAACWLAAPAHKLPVDSHHQY